MSARERETERARKRESESERESERDEREERARAYKLYMNGSSSSDRRESARFLIDTQQQFCPSVLPRPQRKRRRILPPSDTKEEEEDPSLTPSLPPSFQDLPPSPPPAPTPPTHKRNNISCQRTTLQGFLMSIIDIRKPCRHLIGIGVRLVSKETYYKRRRGFLMSIFLSASHRNLNDP